LRVLIIAIGSAGDVHPFLGIGAALKARGHEVIISTSPFFEEVVRNAGLHFRALGTLKQYELLQSDADLWHPRKGSLVVLKKATTPSYQPILNIARELNLPGNTVLVSSFLAFGAINAREMLGIPLVSIHLSPALFASRHRPPVIYGFPFGQKAPQFLKNIQGSVAAWFVDRLLCQDLNNFRKANGLAPLHDLLRRGWHSPDRVIALFPEWFAAPQPDWPPQTRMTGFPLYDEATHRPLPDEVEAFLAEGEPPVIFTPGSAMSCGHVFFTEAVKALQLSGRRGILLSKFPESVPRNLPPSILYSPYIPFSKVLLRAAALVYHGGIGTCSQALQAGIPHLIQPMAHDQHETLSRILDLGVGQGLLPAQFTAARISAKLDELIKNPDYKIRAKALAKSFESKQWMLRTCQLIEEMLPAIPNSTSQPPGKN
jgi:UDP:flavonoid glycosyltransferase YjiC (YdhE family)